MRYLNLGTVSRERSIAAFHAVADLARDGDPMTLITAVPERPFVSIGYHQLASREVAVDFCRAHDISIARRMVGGGAVLLDPGQVFFHLIFPGGHSSVNDLFAALLPGVINAYQKMGVPAEIRPLNDIVVGPRKLGGTGAATLGQSLVFVGSLLFDFDRDLMVQVLKVPSEKFRDKMLTSLRDYMTTLREELGERTPSHEEGARILAEAYGELLEEPLEPGTLTEAEEARTREFEARLFDPAFVFQNEGWRTPGVKIRDGVYLYEGLHKVPNGLVRAVWLENEGRIEQAWVGGDFFVEPADALTPLQEALQGQAPRSPGFAQAVEEAFARIGVGGLTAADLVQAFANPTRLGELEQAEGVAPQG